MNVLTNVSFSFFLYQMIINNLMLFSSAIKANVPLFQVESLLAPPDVVLHPQANEVYKLTLQCVRDCVEGWVPYEIINF